MSKPRKQILKQVRTEPKKSSALLEDTVLNDRKAFLICIAVVAALYLASLFNGFTNWDDSGYVTGNLLIKKLSWASLNEIFTKPVMGNYHPLTMLSYAIEYRLAELNPFIYHFTNYILHLANTYLVYRLVKLLSGSIEVSFFVAMMFGVHPMHVESVAWVSERKDVLYALFYLSSLVFYVRYAKEGLQKKFLVYSLVLFLLSLFSKGQATSLSVAVLAIDFWLKREWSAKLLLEKIPFLLLSLIFGIAAIYAQHTFGYMTGLQLYTFTDRIFFAFHALDLYFFKLFLPVNLSCFYPFPAHKDFLIYIAPVIVCLLLFFVFRSLKKTRLLVFGTGFFLVTIFLVLQLLPVGGAIISDRYTYIPYIGLFFIAGYWLNQLILKNPERRSAVVFLCVLAFACYSVASFQRIRIWKDSIILWTDAISKNSKVAVSYNNRGSAYKELKKNDLAISDFSKALQLNPNYYDAMVGRGELFRIAGQFDQAMTDLNKAIQARPGKDWSAYMSRAIVFCIKGDLGKAKADFDQAFALEKNSPELYCNRGNYYDMSGQFERALADYTKAMEINPKYENAYLSRGSAKARKNRMDEALEDFNTAIKVKPDYAEAFFDRSYVYNTKKEYRKALDDALKARELGFTVDENYLNSLKSLTGAL